MRQLLYYYRNTDGEAHPTGNIKPFLENIARDFCSYIVADNKNKEEAYRAKETNQVIPQKSYKCGINRKKYKETPSAMHKNAVAFCEQQIDS
jgi:hypothetical protein